MATMNRRLTHCLLAAVVLAALPGCRSASSSEATRAPQPGRRGDVAEAPKWLLLPWGTELSAKPGGPAVLQLVAPSEPEARPGRAVRVVGSEAGWWIVETVDTLALAELEPGPEPIEHLEVYELRLYVPAGTGTALEPEPEPEPDEAQSQMVAAAIAADAGILGALADPPLQSGDPRPVELQTDWRVSPGAKIYWPDGCEAGLVAATHAFVDAGTLVQTEAGALRCHPVVAGPTRASLGQLCFEPDALAETEVMASAFANMLAGDEALLDDALDGVVIGEAYGEAYGVGGLGLAGSGSGGGGSGGVVGGIGMVGTGRGGGGYGSGVVEPEEPLPEEPLPEVEARSVVAKGPDQAASERTVEARLRTVARCLDEARARDPELTGSLKIELEVDESGKVLDPQVETQDTGLAECVTRKVRRWRFASAAPGSVIVELAFETTK
jgi:hypothetical protein